MFKRPAPRNLRERLGRLWPKKGWRRTIAYLLHRLRRLPDAPHRIARGVAAGIFASFTPLYGLHFILAGMVAWGIGGNIVAAMIGTAVGNPLTFPFIASLAVELGLWILNQPGHMPPGQILAAFTRAALQLSENFAALFGTGQMEWGRLSLFFQRVFVPYLVGGTLAGLVAAAIGHVLTLRLVLAYQKLRARRRAGRHRGEDTGADRVAPQDAPPTTSGHLQQVAPDPAPADPAPAATLPAAYPPAADQPAAAPDPAAPMPQPPAQRLSDRR